MNLILRALIMALGLALGNVAHAQSVQSPVLTIDSERFYRDSAFGQRIASDIDNRTSALSEGNRKLEAELETEELALTEQRPTMPPEEFRALADAFDARVEAIRREREIESREIAQLLEESRDRFLNTAAPLLEDIMQESGALVILERRSVFVSSNAIDITAAAITRIDEVLGDGDTAPE